ncbi:MAG: hypothetical protein VKO64_05850 [Candidatus Sericytochromatia bacterium]|nr:hypothetical protein [Candidatus Sericytochromatia bacterium]
MKLFANVGRPALRGLVFLVGCVWVVACTAPANLPTAGVGGAAVRADEGAPAGATLRIVVALPPALQGPEAERDTMALSGFIDRIEAEIRGTNVPGGRHTATFTRKDFRGKAVVLVFGRLLPGQVTVTLTFLDRSDRLLGKAVSDLIEVGPAVPAEATLSLIPEEGSLSVPFDPVTVEPTTAVRLDARIQPFEQGQWTQVPPLLLPRTGGSLVLHDGALMAVLGAPSPSVERRDPVTGHWRLVPLPSSYSVLVRDAAIQPIAGSLHVFGGDSFGVDQPFGSGLEMTRIRPEAALPDRVQNVSRSSVAVVPQLEGDLARSGAASFLWQDEVVLVGGRGEHPPETGLPRHGWVLPVHGSAHAASRGTWRRLAGLQSPRADLAGATVDGRMVAVGGRTLSGATGKDRLLGLPWYDAATAQWTAVSTVETYDPVEERWQSAPALPEARWDLAAVGHAGRVWVSGGRNASGQPTATVWSWAPGEASWRPEPSMTRVRASHGMAVAPGGLLMVAGGEGLDAFTSRHVEVMRP